MSHYFNLADALRAVDARGPRYCVQAEAGGAFTVSFHLDSASAEAKCDQLEDEGGWRFTVHPPRVAGFDIDLAGYGRDRLQAQAALAEATGILRAAVLRATELGRAEAEIARAAGVSRMTVRAWTGKDVPEEAGGPQDGTES